MPILDPSSFTTPRELLGLYAHMGTVKKHSNRGTIRRFKAKALTDAVPLDIRLLTRGELSSEAAATVSRYITRVRIEPQLYGLDPHAFLDDPCSPTYAKDIDEASRIIQMHTLAITAKNFIFGDSVQINRGDIVEILCKTSKDGTVDTEYATIARIERRVENLAEALRCADEDPSAEFTAWNGVNLSAYYEAPEVSSGKGGKCPEELPLSEIEPLFGSIRSEKPTYNYFPIGNNNYRYKQPTLGNIKWMYENDGIKRIIRSNGSSEKMDMMWDNQIGGCVTREIEEGYCEHLGIEYHKISAHRPWWTTDEWIPGKGYYQSVERSLQIFKQGHTLYHCTHGADRTGMAVGNWLRKEGYKYDDNPFGKRSSPPSYDEIFKYVVFGKPNASSNTWYPAQLCKHQFTQRAAIARYIDTIYPMWEFCKSASNTEGPDCPGCKEWNEKYPEK